MRCPKSSSVCTVCCQRSYISCVRLSFLWVLKLRIISGSPLDSFYSHGEDVQCVHRAPHHLKVVLEDGDCPGQSLVSAAAEQSHSGVQQNGGYERWVWDSTQAFDAAFKASLPYKEIKM